MIQVSLKKPDDFHLHLREGLAFNTIIPHLSRIYHRVLLMPNTNPPLLNLAKAEEYYQTILRVVGRMAEQKEFEKEDFRKELPDFLINLYLNSHTERSEVRKVKEQAHLLGYKLYPKNATTRADWGVKEISSLYPILEEMEKQGVPLMVHGEVVDKEVDIFDREKVFIERELIPIVKRFPQLNVTLEHITTKEAVDFISDTPKEVKATITPHHLYINRSDIFSGGIRPHYFCLPIAKREQHRKALVDAATSGSENFFLGTDSAPHSQSSKESACGCAGIYTSPIALFLYCEIFYQAKSLHHLEDFASNFGSRHYGLNDSKEGSQQKKEREKITLVRQENLVPEHYPYLEGEKLIPFKAGENVFWRLKH